MVIAAAAALVLGRAVIATAAPLPTGACCNSPNGCCPADGGACFVTTAAGCAIGYQGDGTSCDLPQCTTTTTSLPMGACCEWTGSCTDKYEQECFAPSVYLGDGSRCFSAECPLITTTTLPPAFLCGDYNNDGKITAPDALGVLKAAVGTVECLYDVCDASGDSKISAPDALLVLKYAIGLPVKLACPITF